MQGQASKIVWKVVQLFNQAKNNKKKALAFAALTKACQKKQPRGLFTFKGFRYDDGRLDLKKSIKIQFIDAVEVFNNSIFDNKQKNISIKCCLFIKH